MIHEKQLKRVTLSRRNFVRAAAWPPLIGALAIRAGRTMKKTATQSSGMWIDDVSHEYEEYRYRAPYRFGGRDVDRVTLLNVKCIVHLDDGRVAHGLGSMTMGNVWSFPSNRMSYDTTLGAMKALAGEIQTITSKYKEPGHPVGINFALDPEYLKAAAAVSQRLHLDEPIPKLCTLVTASPFDAALHDAYGKVHGMSAYHTYGRDFLTRDLSNYLSPAFKGEHLDHYLLREPVNRLALFHSVGASDPIVAADIKRRINDGLPETLPEWIRYNGLTHIKIKLDGNDLEWDLSRIEEIDHATAETQKELRVKRWAYSLDFNERCPNVEYLLEFVRRLKEKSPAAFDRILYIEQPTARDLENHRENNMHEAAKLKPVIIDESLTGLDRLMLAREMGYTGVALKACKGQTQALLMAAAGRKYNMFLCVQDLTCPGASLLESVGLAAHVPGVQGVEANAREYVPAANKPWENKFPGVFSVRNGMMDSSALNGPGLGVVP